MHASPFCLEGMAQLPFMALPDSSDPASSSPCFRINSEGETWCGPWWKKAEQWWIHMVCLPPSQAPWNLRGTGDIASDSYFLHDYTPSFVGVAAFREFMVAWFCWRVWRGPLEDPVSWRVSPAAVYMWSKSRFPYTYPTSSKWGVWRKDYVAENFSKNSLPSSGHTGNLFHCYARKWILCVGFVGKVLLFRVVSRRHIVRR